MYTLTADTEKFKRAVIMNSEKTSEKLTNILTKEEYKEYLIGQVKKIDDIQCIYGLSESDRIKLMVLEFDIVKELYKLDNEKK